MAKFRVSCRVNAVYDFYVSGHDAKDARRQAEFEIMGEYVSPDGIEIAYMEVEEASDGQGNAVAERGDAGERAEGE